MLFYRGMVAVSSLCYSTFNKFFKTESIYFIFVLVSAVMELFSSDNFRQLIITPVNAASCLLVHLEE